MKISSNDRSRFDLLDEIGFVGGQEKRSRAEIEGDKKVAVAFFRSIQAKKKKLRLVSKTKLK